MPVKGAETTSFAKVPMENELAANFLRFREVSTEFVKELNRVADFTAMHDRSKAAQTNVVLTKKVFSKWSLEILVLLYSLRTLGFGQLRRSLEGITSRILSAKLKTLENLGLVEREVVAARPPRVNYRLTEKGLTVAKLGEPVILYLRYTEGVYSDPKT